MRFIAAGLKIMAGAGVLVAVTHLSSIIPAQASNARHMNILGRTSQPIGHYYYCQENPEDCKTNSESPLAPVLTKTMWKQMVEINHFANSTVEPVSDLDQYKQEEYWTLPGKYGDCEDYVLLKRKLLMEKGWKASTLLVSVVKLPNGDGHAVLTVRTDKVDYVLDSLKEKILPWNQTEYRYLKRQSTLHSGQWMDIQDLRDIVGALN